MPEEIKDLKNQLESLQSDLIPLIKENSEKIKNHGQGSEEILKKMGGIATEMDKIKASLAEIEASKAPASRGTKNSRGGRSIGRRFTQSDAYKAWRKTKGVHSVPNSDKAEVGTLFEKAVSISVGDETAGDLVLPYYRPGIVEKPKFMPFVRDLVTVLPVASSDVVKTDREASEWEIATQLTAVAPIGTSVFSVKNTQGFDNDSPFKEITLNNGSAEESLLINSIDHDTMKITTTAVSTIAMAADDAIYASAYTPTIEGALVPQQVSRFEDYDVPIVDLFTSTNVTLNKLRDVTGLEDAINRRALSSVARMEDINCLYGTGGSGKMTGIFNDAGVTELAWSAQTAGTNAFDFFLNAYYALAGKNFTPTALVVNPAVHKLFVDMKASDGHYLFLPSLSDAATSTAFAIRFMWSNSLLATHGVLADWDAAMTIYDREQAEISIGNANDDFTRRRKTILAGERVGFGIELPSGVIRLIFDSAP